MTKFGAIKHICGWFVGVHQSDFVLCFYIGVRPTKCHKKNYNNVAYLSIQQHITIIRMAHVVSQSNQFQSVSNLNVNTGFMYIGSIYVKQIKFYANT